jgi:choline-sulfatase
MGDGGAEMRVELKRISVLLGLCAMAFGAAARDQRPNIVLLISDQHSGKIMTQAGYPHINTPGIDKLAAEGVTFTRSYCTYPVCVASRASIMTGLMPNKSHSDLTAFPGIGKTMQEAGYETVYFGKWHVSNSEIDEVADWHGFQTWQEESSDTLTKQHAVDYLNGKKEKPFFMVVSFMNPHDCCQLARNIAGLGTRYHDGPVEENMDPAQCPPLPANFAVPPNEAEGFSIRRNPDPETEPRDFRKHPVRDWGETEWRQYMYGYDRLVEKVDNHILDVVNALEKQGLLENTLIIYTADHGDGHASHQWNQKQTFYEESINVPFVVSWKGRTKANIVDSKTLISSGLDIYPTLCSAAGITGGESIQGRDVGPYVLRSSTGKTDSRDFVVSELIQRRRGKTLTGRMVATEHCKYFLFDSGENREQLFDLQEDPGEMRPVTDLDSYSRQLVACRQMLKDWIVKTADSFPLDKIPQ